MVEGVNRLLAVSWCMPPLLYPRSIQVSRGLAGLARRGWNIDVVTVDPTQREGIDPFDATISKNLSGYYRNLLVKADTVNGDAIMSAWLKPAVAAARQALSENHYVALVTFAQPWVDHLVGLEIKRNLNMPWVAHFSDPWVDSLYYASVPQTEMRRWRKWERDIMKRADAVVFTNAHARDLVMKKYPAAWKQKSHVVSHAYERSLMADIIADGSRSRMRWVYTGDFYGPRKPDGFLKALGEINAEMPLEKRLEVVFVGRSGGEDRQLAERLGLEKIVVFKEQVPYLESLKEAAQADALLLIDAPSQTDSPFLPSKLVDYLMFGRLIIGLTPRQGAAADLLHRLACPVVSPDDINGIKDILIRVLKNKTENADDMQLKRTEIDKFDLDATAIDFENVIRQAVAKPQKLPFWEKWLRKN